MMAAKAALLRPSTPRLRSVFRLAVWVALPTLVAILLGTVVEPIWLRVAMIIVAATVVIRSIVLAIRLPDRATALLSLAAVIGAAMALSWVLHALLPGSGLAGQLSDDVLIADLAGDCSRCTPSQDVVAAGAATQEGQTSVQVRTVAPVAVGDEIEVAGDDGYLLRLHRQADAWRITASGKGVGLEGVSVGQDGNLLVVRLPAPGVPIRAIRTSGGDEAAVRAGGRG